ncbi:cobyrinate a,c-diamide synthase [Halorubrum cibi]|uniref:Hydrogenobyrinic acid a,c-diamide synthase (Glutamine-hydrolysing) /cobyrinate a,c-diamide synthase n=1 Tax=Halorubrum cibi TaxID=413815 RepID=A0A521DD92_9EURY|nr:cobyrinate a,c-diamide synthase [Halorubrum cibi]SMO69649.1 hydrogenobyrinic acid a,c-diamide synthase (glutamine-hydrolysing) /cobyrinate a,c-diamide synthase [Halorubrum cibi]
MYGLVLGGTASGVGKTVASLAVSRALADAGYDPVPAKAGPDYIDPSHHAAALGRPSRTLDTWMQGVEGVRRNLRRARAGMERSAPADPDAVAVVEGMMGLYDGSATSTAATATALDVPIVLVVDAGTGMQSVGATALGFREYAAHADLPGHVREHVDDPRIDVVGVIAQKAHTGRHADGIREALPDGIDWLGHVPPTDDLEIPDRHLGLEMGDETPIPEAAIAEAAETIDAGAVARVAEAVAPPKSAEEAARSDRETGDDRPIVAVAADDAFRFVYPATRERLRELATVETFAPVAGDDLPDCDAVYLPGGYPENHAAALSSSPALSTLADRAADGLPVLGECGGLMALSASLTTTDGETHSMAGILPGGVRMHDRYRALDHVELRATGDGVTAAAGERHRGHEFHYSSHAFGEGGDAIVSPDADARFAFEVERGEGIDGDRDGLVAHRTVGTYAHRHPASGAFDRLVASAAEYANGS